jgi:hypothetical protein
MVRTNKAAISDTVLRVALKRLLFSIGLITLSSRMSAPLGVEVLIVCYSCRNEAIGLVLVALRAGK